MIQRLGRLDVAEKCDQRLGAERAHQLTKRLALLVPSEYSSGPSVRRGGYQQRQPSLERGAADQTDLKNDEHGKSVRRKGLTIVRQGGISSTEPALVFLPHAWETELTSSLLEHLPPRETSVRRKMTRQPKEKLLFVHYNANSTGSFVEKTVAQIEYLKDEFDITVALPGEGPFTQRISATGVPVVFQVMHENEGVFRYSLNCARFLSFLRSREIDLVYFLDYVWWKPAEVLATRLLGIPMVSYCGFYKSKDDLRGFIAASSRIVVNSEATAGSFRGSGLEGATEVIHNFVDCELYAAQEDLRQELGLGAAPVVGYLGVLHPLKGIEYLLEAFAEIRRKMPVTTCLIVGPEKEAGYAATLKSFANRLGIASAVNFLGYRADVSRVLNSLSLLVVPSLDEPFGFINVEAGAAGRPVVATRVGGIPEIVVEGETGFLVDARNSDQIAARCLELLANPALQKQMGAAARERVKRRFSKEAILPKWGELFRGVLSKS